MLLMPLLSLFIVYFFFLAGVIALLDEHDDDLKVYALQKLNGIVDQFWAEISDAVSKM
jgi:26S proteasome regulatory subunit N2